MKDRYGNTIYQGCKVCISETTVKKYHLTAKYGEVVEAKYNTEHLVTVATCDQQIDLHAKSLSVEPSSQ